MAILHKNITASADIHNPKWFIEANNGDYAFKNEKGELESIDELLLPAALNFVDGSVAPPTTNSGDIYILSSGGSVNAGWGSVSLQDWVRYDGTAWNSITPQKSSLCYDKNADSLMSFNGTAWSAIGGGGGGGGNTIYTADDSLTGDRVVDLNNNKLTFDFDQSTSTETAPMNFEFGGGFGGYYSRWDDDGGLVIKSASIYALRVVSKVDATASMFHVGKEGGGFISTNGNRLWTIADETTSTTKNEFNDNRISQYFAGTEYHRIQTGGGAASGIFFHMPGFGSLGNFIVGGSSLIGTEKISLQGHTVIQGDNTLPTVPALQIYDSDTTPNILWDFRNNGDVYLGKETTIRADYQEMLTLESSASNPSLVINALTSTSNTNIEFARVNSKKWLIGNLNTDDSFRFYNFGAGSARLVIKSNTTNITLPTSSSGLSSGDLWNDGGTVKIV